MKLLFIFFFLFFISYKAFSVEIILEEGGNKRIIRVPDNNKDILLKITTADDTTQNDTSKENSDRKAVNGKKTKKEISVKKNRYKEQATKETKIQNSQKNIDIIDVYHYFYPCSDNLNMKDCIPDEKIKFDRKTNRVVILENDKIKNVDIIDKNTKRIQRTFIVQDNSEYQHEIGTQNKRVIPIFTKSEYKDENTIPFNNKNKKIRTTYNTKTIAVVKE